MPLMKSAERYRIDFNDWGFIQELPIEAGHISCVRVNETILLTSWEFNLMRYSPASNNYVNLGLDSRGDHSPNLLGSKTLALISNELYLLTQKGIHNISPTG